MKEEEKYIIRPEEIIAYSLLEETSQKGQCNTDLLSIVIEKLPGNSTLKERLLKIQRKNLPRV